MSRCPLITKRLACRAAAQLVGWCSAVLSLLLFAGPVMADETDPVDSGRDALQRAGSLPWYDADLDELRRADVHPPGEPPSRSDAEGQEFEDNTNNSNQQFTGDPSFFWFLLQWTGWALIGLIILLALFLAIRSLAGRGGDLSLNLPEIRDRIVSDVDRIEQLPIPIKRNLSDLLGEAQRHYEQGNYNEAIIYLYSYFLVELDKAQHIRLLRGKTNRQYLREMYDVPPTMSDLVERTMVAFEDVFFGDHNLERARFESCYRNLDEFQQYVEPAAV